MVHSNWFKALSFDGAFFIVISWMHEGFIYLFIITCGGARIILNLSKD